MKQIAKKQVETDSCNGCYYYHLSKKNMVRHHCNHPDKDPGCWGLGKQRKNYIYVEIPDDN